jgi:hypothetical protein
MPEWAPGDAHHEIPPPRENPSTLSAGAGCARARGSARTRVISAQHVEFLCVKANALQCIIPIKDIGSDLYS